MTDPPGAPASTAGAAPGRGSRAVGRPAVAPSGTPCDAVGLAGALRHDPVLEAWRAHAEPETDGRRPPLRVADDAGGGGHRFAPDRSHVRELLVLVAQRPALGQAV